MASSTQSSDFSPLAVSFREMLADHLPESSSEGLVVIHSAPIVHTAYNVLRNLHYTLLADHFGQSGVAHFLSSRVSFLEGALISLAMTIHHFFFAIVYTGIVALTVGRSDSLARDCYHHWVNSYYSLLSTGTSLVSFVTPRYGSELSINLMGSILNSILDNYHKDINPKKEKLFVAKIKKVFNEHYGIIRNWARGHYADTFEKKEGPCLERLKEYVDKARALHYHQENTDELSLLDVFDLYRRNLSDVQAFDEAVKSLKLARSSVLKTGEVPTEPAVATNFSPLVTSVRDLLHQRLEGSSSRAMVVVHSSALIHTAYNTIRNLHYSFLANHFGVNDVPHVLSSRVAFIEGALVSLASTIHNLFFAIVYTAIGILTFGLSGNAIAKDRDHHWSNAYYSFLSIITAIVSIVTPKYGSYLSIGLFIYVLRSILNDYSKEIGSQETQLLGDLKDIFNAHYKSIYNKAKGWYGKTFAVQEGPSLEWLRQQINKAETIHYYSDKPDQICLVNVFDEFRRKFPYLKPEK